ncbi:flavin-containing monooxygenase [Pseudonocardia spinosispora]|uniref:flavin-containing monooxygenase n=1 Tax=Pseudonocardia spinosispora TaxID=103441 RepID=UPI00040F1E46|nr:NAD(P)/FAD-dependent oxidoreductase [Pseudonocardia spinosispora]
MTDDLELDAVVVGAGFSGLYALHVLRDRLGLSVRAIDRAGGVGGVWYWNRYPGARCDIESYSYSYSFSPDLQQEWRWSERFAGQPEILRYLEHVADRFDLRRDIVLDTRITSATWDDDRARWVLTTDIGDRLSARYLISGAGNLSEAATPELDGLDTFDGPVYSTARWPRGGVDFTGKRVAVIGTGSSGIQVIPHIAAQAAHLTVFQRTANYATPIGNGTLDPEFARLVKADYPNLRRRSRDNFAGLPFDLQSPSALAVSDHERSRVYQERWDQGGFRLFLDSYADLFFDEKANDTAAEFIRDRIRERVTDPATAELLCPTDHPYATKRPPLESGYYETYNRDTVELVDLRSSPIQRIIPRGIRTEGAAGTDHALDAIVLATGFDGFTGPLLRMGIRGRDGRSLREHWSDGPHTYLGLMTHGFPNLFTITGPQSPSQFYNHPLAAEDHVDWLADCISHLRERGVDRIEPSAEAEHRWGEHTDEVASGALLPRTDSWFMGSNVPGKPRALLIYLGGAPAYRRICADVAERGYQGFLFDGVPAAEGPGATV